MNRLRESIVVLVLAVTFFLSGCDKDKDVFDAKAQFEKEVAAIDSYLESNNITHIKDKSGIRIVPTLLEGLLPAQLNSTIDVDYKGSLFSSGAVFEEGNAKAPLNNFIAGWQ